MMSIAPNAGASFMALACAPLPALACSSAELMPLVPSDHGVAVVRESQLEQRAEVQLGEHGVPHTLTPFPYAMKG